MMNMPVAAVLFLVAAIIAYWGILRFRRWAERRNMLDLPNERSSHTRPVARGGGLIIVAVTLLGASGVAVLSGRFSSRAAFLLYAAGALLVAFVSWMDDVRSVPSPIRLAVHFVAAGVVIAGLGYWSAIQLPVVGILAFGWFGAVVTAVWIVGLTNAYNFMDGTDGIAGGQACVAGLGWAFLGWTAGAPLISGIGLLIAGSSLGFLFHNWPPARIFMGDIGSAFLGYTLAVLPLMLGFYSGESAGAPVVGLLLVWPFVFDTAFTFTRRLFRKENVFAAHRSHLYQRMTTSVSGHAKVALLYAGLTLAGVLLAQVWSLKVVSGAVTGLLAVPFLCLGLWILTIIQERRLAGESG